MYLLTPIVANTYFVLGANALAHSFTQNKIFLKLTRIDNKIDNNCLKKVLCQHVYNPHILTRIFNNKNLSMYRQSFLKNVHFKNKIHKLDAMSYVFRDGVETQPNGERRY